MSSGESLLRSASSSTLASSPNGTSPVLPLDGRAPFPETGKSKPQVARSVPPQVVHCRLDNIPPVAPGIAPALARLSWRRACTYRCLQITPAQLLPTSHQTIPVHRTAVNSS